MRTRFLTPGFLLVMGAAAQPPTVPGNVVELANLRYIEIKMGEGAAAAAGQEYTVHYTGWLRDGTKFDSSLDRNDPIKFVQGRRQVITGWELGFEGMKVGGKRRLFIPYQLAYGAAGRGSIPPKAELVFDVELLEVKDAPQLAPAVDVLPMFIYLEARVMTLAKDTPEEKYSWRPAAGAPTFAEVLLRIPQGNRALLGDTPASVEAAAGKQRVLELLGESLSGIRKTLESARPSLFNRDAVVGGKPTTMRGVYTSIDTHIAEQLGEATAYARMMGVQR